MEDIKPPIANVPPGYSIYEATLTPGRKLDIEGEPIPGSELDVDGPAKGYVWLSKNPADPARFCMSIAKARDEAYQHSYAHPYHKSGLPYLFS